MKCECPSSDQSYEAICPFAASRESALFQRGIGPGQSCDFEIRFSPTGEGKFAGIFSLTTNDKSPSPVVALHGTGMKGK